MMDEKSAFQTPGHGRSSATRQPPEVGVAVLMEDQLGATIRLQGRTVIGNGCLGLGPADVLNVNDALAGGRDDVFAGGQTDVVDR